METQIVSADQTQIGIIIYLISTAPNITKALIVIARFLYFYVRRLPSTVLLVLTDDTDAWFLRFGMMDILFDAYGA